jgi:NADH-quinone oxidoreductase subunit M
MAALFGLAIAAAGFLSLYRTAFCGPTTRREVLEAEDLRPREWAVLVILITLIGAIGLHPGPWLEIVRPAAEAWAAGVVR